MAPSQNRNRRQSKRTRRNGPVRKMPVTLVSGFLGSGKTSLLSHVLTNKDSNVKYAVIVNEISEFNVDAMAVEGAALLQSEEKMVEMSNGCICCTLREDLLEQLQDLHAKGFDAVLIESSGIAEPMQVAETFFIAVDGLAGDAQVLQHIAPLDNCVTVVDAGTLIEYMNSIESTSKIDKKARDTEDEMNIATLMFDQLEFANVIILNKIDVIEKKAAAARALGVPEEEIVTVDSLTSLINKIAPKAKIFPVSYSKVDLKEVLSTNNFTEHFANSVQGWMEDMKENGIKHVPETEEYGVSSLSFTPKIPFHPGRLHAWITLHLILEETLMVTQEQIEAIEAKKKPVTVEEWQEDIKLRGERRVARYGNLFRGKGYVWLGQPCRNHLFGAWGQAGGTLTFSCGGPWEEFPNPNGSSTNVVAEPGQRLIFIGQHLNKENLIKDLTECLCTPEEIAQLEAAMKLPLGEDQRDMHRPDIFPDPFGPFEGEDGDEEEEDEEEEEDDHDHDHDCEGKKKAAVPLG